MATVYEAQKYGQNKVWLFAGVELCGAKSTSANVTLTFTDGRLVYCDASGGAYTILLPADPYEGMTWMFAENANSANLIEINGNGNTIDGGVMTGITMAAAGAIRVLRFNGTEWRIMEAFR